MYRKVKSKRPAWYIRQARLSTERHMSSGRLLNAVDDNKQIPTNKQIPNLITIFIIHMQFIFEETITMYKTFRYP